MGPTAIARAAWFRDKPSKTVVVAAFSCVALVLVAFTLLGNRFLTGSHSQSDEGAYLYFAHNILHGTYAVSAQQSDGVYLWHGPGLSLIIAPLVALHAGVQAIRLIGPCSLLAAGALFMMLLRRWVSPWLALAGGIALALFPPFLRLLPKLYSEPLTLALLIGSVLALVKAYESDRLRYAFLSGAVGGLMVLTRVEFGWLLILAFVAVVIVATWRRRRKDLLNLICATTAFAVCVPWLAYTASLSHKFPYWASSGGESLYWMAVPVGTGSWESSQQVLSDPRWAQQQPLFQRLSRLPQVQRDSELQRIAFRLIRQQPGAYGGHLIDNLSRMVIGGPYTFQSTGAARYLLYAAPDLLMLLGVCIAGRVLWRNGRPRVPPFVALLIGIAIANLLIHLPVSAYPRMATFSVPAGLAIIALGIESSLRQRARRHEPTAGVLA